jgi:hypothetical protein
MRFRFILWQDFASRVSFLGRIFCFPFTQAVARAAGSGGFGPWFKWLSTRSTWFHVHAQIRLQSDFASLTKPFSLSFEKEAASYLILCMILPSNYSSCHKSEYYLKKINFLFAQLTFLILSVIGGYKTRSTPKKTAVDMSRSASPHLYTTKEIILLMSLLNFLNSLIYI